MDGIEIFKVIWFSFWFIIITIGIIVNVIDADEQWRLYWYQHINNRDDF